MIVFPNCKINLGLQVLQKRADGFHGIETIFYPVPLKDALEIVPAANSSTIPALNLYGLPVLGDAADNLCIKAWGLLKNDFPELPAVDIHLLKRIPMGAGLGGGSADGAFMLHLLNKKFRLQISEQGLAQYALQLGSDCPFFIRNEPCLATGRGELLERIPLDLSPYGLVLINPGIHISTGWAFARLNSQSLSGNAGNLLKTVLQPVSQWKNLLSNDFEGPVFEKYPQIRTLKENLYQQGAVYAAMSGSGSTVFGLFTKQQDWAGHLPAHYSIIPL